MMEFARVGGRRARLGCWGAIALAIVGVFGTWRSSGPVSLSGVEGPHNGWLVIIFGLMALAGVGALSHGGWLGIVTVAGAAAVMLYAAVSNLIDDNAVLGGQSGWGVWLTIVASALLAGVAVLAAVARIRGSTRAGSTASP
jgi:hypothetical protein